MLNKIENNIMTISRKEKHLDEILLSLKKVIVAFSGGVDSTYLLVKAKQVLGENVIAVLVASETFPGREYDAAVDFATKNGIRLIETRVYELMNESFVSNNPDRCYHCKTGLFSQLKDIAKENDIPFIVDGSNSDDLSDYRPGTKAKEEQGVRSPLQEARLNKEEIRILSKNLGLPTWNKPSFACLSSRIPYGSSITQSKIDQLDRSEAFLLKLGFKQVRVRHHGEIARIEVEPDEMKMVLNNREAIYAELQNLGFNYITMDIQGYRTGSMNEVIKGTRIATEKK